MNQYIKNLLVIALALVLVNCSEDPIDNFEKGTLTGIAVINGSNIPLENVKISTNPSSSTVFTDVDGNFIIEDIPVEQYSVQAELDGYLTAFEATEITSGVTVNVVFEMDIETANNRPPNTPVLVTPINNAVDVALDTQLVWTGSDPDEDEINYTIELRNDFDDEVLSFSTVNDTMLDITGLRFGLKYFWQVGAKDNINADVIQSVVGVFETINAPENRHVFVRKINGNNVIFSTDTDGNELQLTSSSLNSFRPRQNTAADKIAFLSNSGSETHIFTMDLDGSNMEQITSQVQVNGFNLDEVDFAWTQNGGRLIYPNFDSIYSINVDGTGLQEVYQTTDGSFITEVAISADETFTAVKTNDASGYNVSIFTIDNSGTIIDNVLSGVLGAAGGLDISVDNQTILYWYDVSGFESSNYRQLDSRIFLYNRAMATADDLSDDKDAGTNDFDCRFTPNEAEIIFTNTSNDGVSQRNVLITDTDPNDAGFIRVVFAEDAQMPDFE
ncbi:carboxypeptidase regulatory-like domain-containing protein [uncultured Winogradskyella sp.]|uniref:carboxypeptidase regulatory-like domain-containing protein n=1 Tax=uncultured Winogradskyella sp. TaxID=395353 RepID=UPI002629C5CC|nr:carboxypeptidase regulatory-like domain-containing protein [uncultured Winogradskyella sp.]